MKKLEKQLEFEFMEEIRRERFYEKWGSIPDMVTAVTSVAGLTSLILYTSCPKYIDSIQNCIKSLFH